ncbi:MAG: DUF5685 family protein [Akkermansiaceae bacterium]
MFGYLYAPAASCSQPARSLYQSMFCGLATQMHQDYGPAARFLINRDSTFLALAGSALAEQDAEFQVQSCCNPLAMAKPIVRDPQVLSFAGAVTLCGLSAKLRDNVEDESGWRARLPHLGGVAITPARNKAVSILNTTEFPTQKVLDLLGSQKSVEQSGGADLQSASEPTAKAFGTIFAHLARLTGNTLERAGLLQLGTSLGRLIYWQDAVDDLESDRKRGHFNPLLNEPVSKAVSLIDDELQVLAKTSNRIAWRRHQEVIGEVIHHTEQHYDSKIKKRRVSSAKKESKWYGICDCCSPCDCSDCSCGSSDGCCSCDCDCCSCN